MRDFYQPRKIKPSRQLQHALGLLSHRLHDGLLYVFPDDAQGEALLAASRSAGLSYKKIDRNAPWFHDRDVDDQQRQNADAKHFDWTTFTERVGVTNAKLKEYASERVKCDRVFSKCKRCQECNAKKETHWRYPMRQLLQIVTYTPAELQQRMVDRNKRRNAMRAKNEAARRARYTPRDAVLIEAVVRISHQVGCVKDYSVTNIIRTIERSDDRALFPHDDATFRRIVPRGLDRLERLNALRTATTGKPGRRVRCVTFCAEIGLLSVTPIYSYAPAKSLKTLKVAVTKNGTDLKGESHDSEAADLDKKHTETVTVGKAGLPMKETDNGRHHANEATPDGADLHTMPMTAPDETATHHLRHRSAALPQEATDNVTTGRKHNGSER